MAETSKTPQEGVAEALGDLSEQTRILVRREIGAAQQEMWQKAKDSAPAFALAAAAGTLAIFAVASSYRLSLRLLETRLSPTAAAFTATLGYAAGAVCMAAPAARKIRELPSPFPTETARQTGQALADAAPGTRR